MNLSAGFQAFGQGLNLIAQTQYRREERDWITARDENFATLRQKQALELEDRRTANDEAAAGKQREFIASENDKNRKADDTRAERAERRDAAREERLYRREDAKELAELRRHRATTLQNFRAQYGKALTDYNTAKASGILEQADLEEMRANIEYIAREMQDFDAQSKDALAAAGDSWAKQQTLGDEDMEHLMGGNGGVSSNGYVTRSRSGIPIATESGPGAAAARPKPLSATAASATPPDRLTEIKRELDRTSRVLLNPNMSQEELEAGRASNLRIEALRQERSQLINKKMLDAYQESNKRRDLIGGSLLTDPGATLGY